MTAEAGFTAFSRFLHWLMAALVLTMLFIGVGMVSTVSWRYHLLVSIHKPLGVLIFVLVVIRFVNRMLHPPPPLPDHMPAWQKFVAHASHALLYVLMFILPLVGWAMLSAAPYPIVLYGALHLPPILPRDAMLYATLRQLHTVLAYLFFATFIVHFGAAMMHALIFRDGVFQSMTPWRGRAGIAE